jgi:hypothetical protein
VGACYVEAGFQRFVARRLDDEGRDLDPVDVLRAEAEMIRAAFRRGAIPQDGHGGGGRGLRLHVAGDIEGRVGAEALADAAGDWLRRGGSRPWSYTHRAREVHRRHWGSISVLGSIEDPTDMNAVAKMGYAPALVVEQFPSDTAFKLRGWNVVPCPFETRGITCVECGLCMRADELLRSKTAIGFEVHGAKRHQVVAGSP